MKGADEPFSRPPRIALGESALSALLAGALVFFGIFGSSSAPGQGEADLTMRILRPKPEGEQVSPTWTEIHYIVIDARHPAGIEKLQLFKPGAKKPEREFTESDRHQSGYFFYRRRMKSPGTRNYGIRLWPGGTDPRVDPPITSTREFPLAYANPDPLLPDHIALVNLQDGEKIPANDPSDPGDLTTILIDCQHSSGTWGGGQWKENRHVGYRDDDGIAWVELIISSPGGKRTVLRSGAAFILDRDAEYFGPYWGEAVDPSRSKAREEPWPENTAWKPIEGFGLHLFATSLASGDHRLQLRAGTSDGGLMEGPTIAIQAIPEGSPKVSKAAP